MAKNEVKFLKEQIINSEHFKRVERDILSVILDSGKEYGIEECKVLIAKFNKKEVTI
ncbi:MAG: hypothetical protein RR782_02660 [Clostridium sp.]